MTCRQSGFQHVAASPIHWPRDEKMGRAAGFENRTQQNQYIHNRSNPLSAYLLTFKLYSLCFSQLIPRVERKLWILFQNKNSSTNENRYPFVRRDERAAGRKKSSINQRCVYSSTAALLSFLVQYFSCLRVVGCSRLFSAKSVRSAACSERAEATTLIATKSLLVGRTRPRTSDKEEAKKTKGPEILVSRGHSSRVSLGKLCWNRRDELLGFYWIYAQIWTWLVMAVYE